MTGNVIKRVERESDGRLADHPVISVVTASWF
jgi:hypothetical protein